MLININGNINRYYVQTLCMIFYPGAKFSDEACDDGTPILDLTLRDVDGVCEAEATATVGDEKHTAIKRSEYTDYHTAERTAKIAVGAAIVSVLGELVSYKPSWGILTGVRPSKVATEYLAAGMSKTKVKKLLSTDYLVIPKKGIAGNRGGAYRKKDNRSSRPEGLQCVYLHTLLSVKMLLLFLCLLFVEKASRTHP